MPVHERVDQALAGAQFLVGEAGREDLGEAGRVEAGQVGGDFGPQRVAEPYVRQDRGGQFGARARYREGFGEQIGQVQHFDAA